MKRESAKDRFWREMMAERIVYGGFSMTRSKCLSLMRSAGNDEKAIDYFVMGPADRYGRNPSDYPRIEDHPDIEMEFSK